MASPFGRAGRLTDTGEPEAETWHIGRGPATKSPLWRVGCWLIGLAAVAVCLRCMLWVLGGSAPFQLLVSTWLILLLVAGFFMSVGDEVMTRVWNAVIRRWMARHPPPAPPDPLEEEIRHSIDNDPGWWARDS